MILFGGYNSVHLNTCEQFDSLTNTWSSFPSFWTARYLFGAAVVLNKIYIAGGEPSTSPVEVYSGGSSWSPLSSSLAQARQHCAAVAFQNKLVVLGGDRTTIEVFDPATSTWSTTFPPMKISPSRYDLATVSF